jgi:hypothetical protein
MPVEHKVVQALLGEWAADSIIRIQSAPPVNVTVDQDIGFGFFPNRPDPVPGQPFYIADPIAPLGRRLTPAAFAPVLAQRLGTFGRNVVRGFGSWQADLSLRRQFNLSDRVYFQFRAEFFNIFNHPNFAQPNGSLGSVSGSSFTPNASFGTPATMLNRGLGGLNALHQIGGPRSIQFALRLEF